MIFNNTNRHFILYKSIILKYSLLLFLITINIGAIHAQKCTILRYHIHETGKLGDERKYIKNKYVYWNMHLLYQLSVADNRWQIYDSVTYQDHGDTTYRIRYQASYIPSFRYEEAFIDTLNNKHREKELFPSFVLDQYKILENYLFYVYNILDVSKMQPIPLISKTSSTIRISSIDARLYLFLEYGMPLTAILNSFVCHIDSSGRYDYDIFTFDICTIKRHFKYDIDGNINSVQTIWFENNNQSDAWIDFYVYHCN